MAAVDLQAVISGTQASRVEALRQILGYPLKQRDPEGSRFWFLRSGADAAEAEDTCPIAVGFYAELNGLSDAEIKQFLTAEAQQREIYGHYTGRIVPNQPVMYLLLPESPLAQVGSGAGGEGSRVPGGAGGRVAMVLPSEGGLRQRQIQTFGWADADWQARLNRLRQDTLMRTNRLKGAALAVIPLVEWAFYPPIETARALAEQLARVSQRIEAVIPRVYGAESASGYLHQLLKGFQQEIVPDLKLTAKTDKDYSFADIYAQTLAYGLFTARVFSYTQDPQADFNRVTAWAQLPQTNPFLRQLFKDLSQQAEALGDDLLDAIAEIVSLLRAAKMDAILADFQAKMNREDIVVRFYEDFLRAYKPKMREHRGVYYTPEPVVSYMVRSLDILLKEKFNKPLGLADPGVMILDPACGTGTFLLWICQLIYQRFQEHPDALTAGLADRTWSGYVQERLLPRIFGFELLMAPYAICHLKLGLFLEETGYRFSSAQRLGVYLTNTLDEALHKSESLFEEFIAKESSEAAAIKRDKPIMIVVGNPPYSVNSANKSAWITSLVKEAYYPKDHMKEQNPKMLLDDYVKFIRFGQWRIEQTKQGILAFITNHGYLDNPTFRGMRRSLEQSFDEIYVMDLHGNTKKKEVAPDGSKDENVFDIQQGVSVCFLLKNEE